jgi:hypothetical protein
MKIDFFIENTGRYFTFVSHSGRKYLFGIEEIISDTQVKFIKGREMGDIKKIEDLIIKSSDDSINIELKKQIAAIKSNPNSYEIIDVSEFKGIV